ncbi:MAG: hypothetical protein WBO10_10105 [Pyrinomonadaceae bacterium]
MPKRSNEKGFSSFLKTLDGDDQTAAEKYLVLREKLERFFEWRGCENVEGLTDIVFDRTIKKIIDGEVIENADAYCGSVAKFVLLENRREIMRHEEFDENSRETNSAGIEHASVEEDEKDKRFECLDRCLAEFPVDNRELLIRYFDTDEKTMIRSRKRLADELGTNLNSLRIRVSRLKSKLGRCTKDCCGELQAL